MLNINKIGQGSKPLVFLHGWGFNQGIWRSLLPQLSHQFSCYLVDLPGFGKSSLMSWEAFKEQLINILPEQFAIVGWSLGGLFATKLALEVPQRVSHLINVTSSPYFVKDKEWPGIDQKVLEQFFTNLRQDSKRTTREFIALQLNNFPLTNSKISLVDFSSTEEALAIGLIALANWDLRSNLNKLRSRVCFMFGRLDAIVPRQLLPQMQKLYPQFNYVLFPKAAHIPFITHEKEFIDELESFLL